MSNAGAMWRCAEELTTTRYFGTALIVLLALSRVLQNNVLLLALAGWRLAGPAVVSLLAKDKKLHHFAAQNIAYAAEFRGTAITSSGQTSQTIWVTRILKINLLGNISKVADRIYPRQVLQPDRHIFQSARHTPRAKRRHHKYQRRR